MKIIKIKKFSLNKREKIVIASAILSVGLISTQLVPFYLTYRFIIGLTILAYIVSFWTLREGMDRLKAVILLILPTLFTLAISSYYFLLPVRWLTRLPVAFLFGITFYFLLLSQNVFNVASSRTIPLYRVASTTILILTLITAFSLFNVMFSFHMLFIWNGLGIFLISFPLILQVIWSIEMEKLSSLIIVYTSILSLLIAELGVILSFWPMSTSMSSLVLSTGLYISLGISTHTFRERLNRGVVWEYFGWGVLIFIIAFFATSWKG
ncbi:MAG: hypothetical protein Q7R43_00520 [Candidatus Daviesbacteria bacterium]|nr:hypothetical protein [Candidatus Daviesbacteria bacterium]